MRNANAVGQPKGGVGPSLAAQGFSGIVALKPSTEGIENIAFNDFTLGVDTTAIVQAENIYEASDAFSPHRRQARLQGRRRNPLQPDQHPPRRDLQRQLRLQRVGDRPRLRRLPARRAVQLHAGPGAQLLQPQPLYGRLRAGQLEGQPSPSTTACAGTASAPGGEIQSASNAGQGRAIAGLSRRAAGPGLSRRPRRVPIRWLRRATTCRPRIGIAWTPAFAAPIGCTSSPARPGSNQHPRLATASSIPPTKGYRPAS
jgi:hypothetical protein